MDQSETRDRLQQALTRARTASSDFDLNPEVSLPPGRRLRDAAVLIAVIDTGAHPQVVFTKRASGLKHHPGQIAFPGGKRDEGDTSLIDCALREAQEEIGLAKGSPQVLGTLPCHETVTGFLVTPVLATLPGPFVGVPEAGEVDEVFEVPLHHVTDPSKFSVQSRYWRGQRRYYYTVPYGPYYIWGATARMLRGLAEAMAEG